MAFAFFGASILNRIISSWTLPLTFSAGPPLESALTRPGHRGKVSLGDGALFFSKRELSSNSAGRNLDANDLMLLKVQRASERKVHTGLPKVICVTRQGIYF